MCKISEDHAAFISRVDTGAISHTITILMFAVMIQDRQTDASDIKIYNYSCKNTHTCTINTKFQQTLRFKTTVIFIKSSL